MEQNERKNMNPIFVEPEMVEDLPLSHTDRLKEGAKKLCCRLKRIRLPKFGTILSAVSLLLVLLALLAAPVLPVVAMLILLFRSFRSAFRMQTA